MHYSISDITFVDRVEELDIKDSFVVEIPSDIQLKEQLFDILHEKLNFPWYDGKNFSALAELLRDFSWIEKKMIIIYHGTLPVQLPTEYLRAYIECLVFCVDHWKDLPSSSREFYKESNHIKHELIVTFPRDSKNEIEKILALANKREKELIRKEIELIGKEFISKLFPFWHRKDK